MPECEWAILCDYAFLDVNRKRCLIGTFNEIRTTNVPAHHPQAALALKILGEADEKAGVSARPGGDRLQVGARPLSE